MANSDGTYLEKIEKQPNSAQTESKAAKEKFEFSKRKVELEILEIKKKKLECFSWLLSILVWVFSGALIVGGGLFYFFIKEAKCNTFNWILLIFESLLILSFTVIIMFLANLLKSLVSHSCEE